MGLRQIRSRIGSHKTWVTWTGAALLAAALSTVLVQARTPDPVAPVSAATVPVSGLPPHGQQVMGQILQGGPFRYEKDGTVFFNRERLLPSQKRGYYREYTVPTPGLRHRGARRIVCGGFEPREPDACYYTEDHYASFKRVQR